MSEPSVRLRAIVERATPRLRALPPDATACRPASGKWSAREILGHLVDSTSNNHQRFVRAASQDDLVFQGYEQDAWVAAQRYQDEPWLELVTLWRSFNLHLAYVMAMTPEAVRHRVHTRHNLDRLAFRAIAPGAPVTLDAFMADYVDHLVHHLRQIVGDDVEAWSAATVVQPVPESRGVVEAAPDQRPVLIVTGGSRGIGAATARLAAASGFVVCVNYRRDRVAADQVVAAIEAAGGRAVAVQADVSDESGTLRLFEAADALGRLGGLVNNAGILEQQMRLDTMDAARIRRVFATNVVGACLCAREAVRRMSTRYGGAGGAIVNVSSGAARLGAPGEYVDYAASKGAIDTLTIGLAREVAEEGIRVNAVRPGFIYTEMHASGGEPGRVDRVKAFVPMKRGGNPDEVARAILWLISGDASYTTGAFIDVTGGR